MWNNVIIIFNLLNNETITVDYLGWFGAYFIMLTDGLHKKLIKKTLPKISDKNHNLLKTEHHYSKISITLLASENILLTLRREVFPPKSTCRVSAVTEPPQSSRHYRTRARRPLDWLDREYSHETALGKQNPTRKDHFSARPPTALI